MINCKDHGQRDDDCKKTSQQLPCTPAAHARYVARHLNKSTILTVFYTDQLLQDAQLQSRISNYKAVLQECIARLYHKAVLQECIARLYHKAVLQGRITRLYYKAVLQGCAGPYCRAAFVSISRYMTISNEKFCSINHFIARYCIAIAPCLHSGHL